MNVPEEVDEDVIYAITAVDIDHVWAVGWSGTIIHTSDGGETWQLQETGTKFDLTEVTFADTEHGWAVGNGNFDDSGNFGDFGILLHTDDGGETWIVQDTGVSVPLTSVAFVDSQRGWVGVSNGGILHTTDGGNTWNEQRIGLTAYLTSVDFVDDQNGWVLGEDYDFETVGSFVLHTTDGGNTWSRQLIDAPLNSLSFGDVQRGWVVGPGGTILHSPDGGNTWTKQESGTTAFLTQVAFVDADNGWVVGTGEGGRVILHTADGGVTWTTQLSELEPGLLGTVFLDGKFGWSVEGEGWAVEQTAVPIDDFVTIGASLILHTTDGGNRWCIQGSRLFTELSDAGLWTVTPAGLWELNTGVRVQWVSF